MPGSRRNVIRVTATVGVAVGGAVGVALGVALGIAVAADVAVATRGTLVAVAAGVRRPPGSPPEPVIVDGASRVAVGGGVGDRSGTTVPAGEMVGAGGAATEGAARRSSTIVDAVGREGGPATASIAGGDASTASATSAARAVGAAPGCAAGVTATRTPVVAVGTGGRGANRDTGAGVGVATGSTHPWAPATSSDAQAMAVEGSAGRRYLTSVADSPDPRAPLGGDVDVVSSLIRRDAGAGADGTGLLSCRRFLLDGGGT